MHLSGLYIHNNRPIRELDIKFSSGKNIIIGKNNVGKSNIKKALDIVVGVKNRARYRNKIDHPIIDNVLKYLTENGTCILPGDIESIS